MDRRGACERGDRRFAGTRTRGDDAALGDGAADQPPVGHDDGRVGQAGTRRHRRLGRYPDLSGGTARVVARRHRIVLLSSDPDDLLRSEPLRTSGAAVVDPRAAVLLAWSATRWLRAFVAVE